MDLKGFERDITNTGFVQDALVVSVRTIANVETGYLTHLVLSEQDAFDLFRFLGGGLADRGIIERVPEPVEMPQSPQ